MSKGGTLIVEPGAVLTASAARGWGGIVFLEGSSGEVKGATISNGVSGILVMDASPLIQDNHIVDIGGADGSVGQVEGGTAYAIQVFGDGAAQIIDNKIERVTGGNGLPGTAGAIDASGTHGGDGGDALGIIAMGDGGHVVRGNTVSELFGGKGARGGQGGGGSTGTAAVPAAGNGGDGGNGGKGGDVTGIVISINADGEVRDNTVSELRAGWGGYGGVGGAGGFGWTGEELQAVGGAGGNGGNGGSGGNGGMVIGMRVDLAPVLITGNVITGTLQAGSAEFGGMGGVGGLGGDGYVVSLAGVDGEAGGKGGDGGYGGYGGDGGGVIGLLAGAHSGATFRGTRLGGSLKAGDGAAGGDGGGGMNAGKGAPGAVGGGSSGGFGGNGGAGGSGGSGGAGGDAGDGGGAAGIVVDATIAAPKAGASSVGALPGPATISASYVYAVYGGAAGSAGKGGSGGIGGQGGDGGDGAEPDDSQDGDGGVGGSGGHGGVGGQGGDGGGAVGIYAITTGRIDNNMVFLVEAKAATDGGDGGDAGSGGWSGDLTSIQAVGGNGGSGGDGGQPSPAMGIALGGDTVALHNTGVTLRTAPAAASGGSGGSGGFIGGANGTDGAAGDDPEAYAVAIQNGQPEIYNNIVALPGVGAAFGATQYGIYAQPGVTGFKADYNLVQGWNINYGPGVTKGANDVDQDPLYRDVVKGDLHIKANSPAIDAGAAASSIPDVTLPDYDIDGDARPLSGGYDMGADEYWECVKVTSVAIAGDSTGMTGQDYAYSAKVLPTNAALPLTYTWSPPPDSGQGTAQATYGWTTVGAKLITLTVNNCNGAGSDTANYTVQVTNATQHVYLPGVQR